MTRSVLLCLFLVVLAGVSCSPRSTGVALDTNLISSDELIRLVRSRSDAVRSLDGSGTITFESSRIAGTAAFEVVLKKPDSLLVFLEGPFGIDIGSLFLSGEEYIAYNSSQNLVVTGVPQSGVVQSVLPLELTFDQMINAFAGGFELPAEHDPVRRFVIDDGRFLVEADCGTRRCLYWVDNEYLQISKLEVREDGDLVMEATASSFVEEGQAAVPRRISVWFPGEREQVSVQYRSVTINPGRLSFAYSVPPDARVVRQ